MIPVPPPRRLPAYDPLWSDGCTLAPFLPVRWRARFQLWTIGVIAGDPAMAREMTYICERHDQRYYYGGSKEDRIDADQEMLTSMEIHGIPRGFRTAAYRAVRMWGGPSWQTSGVSWAYGGEHFQYGVRALIQREIVPSEPAQAPKPPLSGHDLWPFNEPKCSCDEGTLMMPEFTSEHAAIADDIHGYRCQGCGRFYTGRKL